MEKKGAIKDIWFKFLRIRKQICPHKIQFPPGVVCLGQDRHRLQVIMVGGQDHHQSLGEHVHSVYGGGSSPHRGESEADDETDTAWGR